MKPDFKQPERLAFIAAAIGMLVAALAGLLAGWARAAMLLPAVLAAGTLAVLSLTGGWRLRLARRRQEEEAAVAEFSRKHTGGELFESADEAVKLAARALKTYERWVIPTLVALVGAGLLVGGWFLMGEWNHPAAGAVALLVNPVQYAVLALGLFVGCMLAGSYWSGTSREDGGRWLRPCGAWLYFTGILLAAGGAGMLLAYWQVSRAEHPAEWVLRLDVRLAKLFLLALMVIGAEMIAGIIFEFYRPRGAHEEDKPVFESRMLALLTEPGGLAANLSAALDYQFGFRVSEGWFYRFLERTVTPFALFAMAAFWLMSTLVVVKPDENGLRTRAGRVVSRTPLLPGAHFKLPWPFEKIHTFPVDSVQELNIGYMPGDGKPPAADDELVGDLTGRVILWSKKHYLDEKNFLVAGAEEPQDANAAAGSRGPMRMNLMTASIPLYFKVRDLYAYHFMHKDARQSLEEVATREVVRYLANVDLRRLLTTGREAGAGELRLRIQAAADGFGLGVEIVFVGLQGIHPPIEVGAAYDDVVAALEDKHAESLTAEKFAVSRVLDAQGAAVAAVAQAKSYRDARAGVAAAEADRFRKQLLAYHASPELFTLYSYLDMLETNTKDIRKYVVAVTGREVIQVDLAKKLRPDLLDLDVKMPKDEGK